LASLQVGEGGSIDDDRSDSLHWKTSHDVFPAPRSADAAAVLQVRELPKWLKRNFFDAYSCDLRPCSSRPPQIE
ncbi:MAG: hypothetical protein ACRD1T_11605, partial [Acidimicrobiia bacterium]